MYIVIFELKLGCQQQSVLTASSVAYKMVNI